MNSRERVLLALKHQEPDCIPFDLGGTLNTGIHHIAYKKLLSHLEIKEPEVHICDPVQQLAQVSGSVRNNLKVDVAGAFACDPSHHDLNITKQDGRKSFKDEYGVTWSMPKDGLYYDMTKHPLSGSITLRDIDNYNWPKPSDIVNIKLLKNKLQHLKKESNCLIALHLYEGIIERTSWLRGYKDFFTDLVRNPSLILSLLDKILDLRLRLWDLVLDKLGSFVDVIIEADDLATQDRPMISPKMYRKYFKPRHKKLFSFIKERISESAYLFFHSCGSIYELIPDLIEAGIDIINPVQVSATNMDSKKLKKEFGSEVTFWGGGIDTQNVLPNGTADEVKEEVEKRISDLAPGGGFIFASVHNIQADVPSENIMAMWETLQNLKNY